jgi:hypothetical protein
MGDIIDSANDAADVFREADISRARAKTARETHPDFDGKNCVEEHCAAPLPQARLDLGRIRCVDCQEIKEDKARRRL